VTRGRLATSPSNLELTVQDGRELGCLHDRVRPPVDSHLGAADRTSLEWIQRLVSTSLVPPSSAPMSLGHASTACSMSNSPSTRAADFASDHEHAPPAGSLSLTFRHLTVSTSPQPSYAQRARQAVAAAWGGLRSSSSNLSAAEVEAAAVAATPARPVKHILHGVSGYIPANKLTAIMGGSGQQTHTRWRG
jgi:hypothetical protein